VDIRGPERIQAKEYLAGDIALMPQVFDVFFQGTHKKKGIKRAKSVFFNTLKHLLNN
jgi:hypothetical protein